MSAERTDSRPLGIRKTSVVMRKIELQAELRAVESAEAEIDRLIEADERTREREACKCGPYYDCADHDTDPVRAAETRAHEKRLAAQGKCSFCGEVFHPMCTHCDLRRGGGVL